MPEDDRKTYSALKAAGADVRYTEFPDTNHDAWDPAYATPHSMSVSSELPHAKPFRSGIASEIRRAAGDST